MVARPKAVDCANPSTRKLERLDENLGSVDIELTPDELADINFASRKFPFRVIVIRKKMKSGQASKEL